MTRLFHPVEPVDHQLLELLKLFDRPLSAYLPSELSKNGRRTENSDRNYIDYVCSDVETKYDSRRFCPSTYIDIHLMVVISCTTIYPTMCSRVIRPTIDSLEGGRRKQKPLR